MSCILPLNVLDIRHPLIDHYRSTLVPHPELSTFMPTDSSVIGTEWHPEEGAGSENGWQAITNGQPAMMVEQLTVTGPLNSVLALAWDVCALHLPLEVIVETKWACYLSRNICLFLPKDMSRQAYPIAGQKHLAKWAGQPVNDAAIALPFLPITLGRGSAHADIHIHKDVYHSVCGVFRMLLPDAAGLLDPAPASAMLG